MFFCKRGRVIVLVLSLGEGGCGSDDYYGGRIEFCTRARAKLIKEKFRCVMFFS